jgi:hypothetical protein
MNSQGFPDAEDVIKFLTGRDHGASSEYILSHLTGRDFACKAWPLDCGDFGRCYRLLHNFPGLHIEGMINCSREWRELVNHWHELSRHYLHGSFVLIDHEIDAILQSCRR